MSGERDVRERLRPPGSGSSSSSNSGVLNSSRSDVASTDRFASSTQLLTAGGSSPPRDRFATSSHPATLASALSSSSSSSFSTHATPIRSAPSLIIPELVAGPTANGAALNGVDFGVLSGVNGVKGINEINGVKEGIPENAILPVSHPPAVRMTNGGLESREAGSHAAGLAGTTLPRDAAEFAAMAIAAAKAAQRRTLECAIDAVDALSAWCGAASAGGVGGGGGATGGALMRRGGGGGGASVLGGGGDPLKGSRKIWVAGLLLVALISLLNTAHVRDFRKDDVTPFVTSLASSEAQLARQLQAQASVVSELSSRSQQQVQLLGALLQRTQGLEGALGRLAEGRVQELRLQRAIIDSLKARVAQLQKEVAAAKADSAAASTAAAAAAAAAAAGAGDAGAAAAAATGGGGAAATARGSLLELPTQGQGQGQGQRGDQRQEETEQNEEQNEEQTQEQEQGQRQEQEHQEQQERQEGEGEGEERRGERREGGDTEGGGVVADLGLIGREEEYTPFREYSTPSGYRFIRFSAHRISPTAFAAIGVAPLSARSLSAPLSHCIWLPPSGSPLPPVRGALSAFFPSHPSEQPSETVVLRCSFPPPAAPGEGEQQGEGRGGGGEGALPYGGSAAAVLAGGVTIPLIREQQPPDEPSTTTTTPSSSSSSPFPPPFPSHLTLCLPPLYGPSLSPRALLEFLSYHRLLGIDSFLLYNAGGATEGVREVVRREEEKGRAVLLDMMGLLEREHMWNHGQVPALHDCIYRSRLSARWLLYVDLDSYLWLPPVTEPRPLPPLHILLETYDAGNTVTTTSSSSSNGTASAAVATAADPSLSGWGDGSGSSRGGSSSSVAGITFGSLWFSIHLCRPRADHEIEVLGLPDPAAAGMAAGREAAAGAAAAGGVPKESQWGGARDGELQVERFVFHWPDPACHENEHDGERVFDPSLCPGEKGHRKFIVDPRRVDTMTVFGPAPSDPAYPRMAHLSTSDLQLLHYRELGSGTEQGVCDEPTPRWRAVGWWHTDATYGKSIAALRQRVTCNFTATGCEGSPYS
ncbi:hypothetical protein CLOP_g6446 [Closterium sp. NIES-67]|nr:hypothetical protein CLOP_g6446 [Closterium sp. NIES-67]